MAIDGKTKKIVILLAVFGVLAVGRLVMYFSWEYRPLPPGVQLPPPKPAVKNVIPTEEKPRETVEDGLLVGRYVRKVSLPLNPEVEVGYLVPVGLDGRPLPGAENMVFYGVANGEGGRVPCSQPWLRQLAKEFRCTVFSLGIRTNLDIAEDREQYYIYRESGWFGVVFGVQEKLAKRFGFPSRKLLLAGESSGGSMVQRIAAAHPDRVAAAAWCGGSRYDAERSGKGGVPCLVLNTWGCPGENASSAFAERERGIGNPLLFARMPPDPMQEKWYHHAPGPESYRLIQEYLGGMAELLYRNGGRRPERKAGEEFLPSALFAASWRNRFRAVPFRGADGVLLMEPHAAEAKCIAVAFGSGSGESRVRMLDALYWLSRSGVIPVQVEISSDLLGERRNAAKGLEAVLREEKWREFPVTVVGFDEAGMPGAVAALANGNPRIRRIVLYGTPCDSPFPELSISENRKRSRIPMLVCGKTGEELLLPDTEFRKFSTAGLTNRSWKSEIEALAAGMKGADDASETPAAN